MLILTLFVSLLLPSPSFAVTEADCTIIGTDGKDVLLGTELDDVICGLGGNDIIEGGSGNDVIFGGDGKDSIEGEDGEDRIQGGPGADLLWGGDGADALLGLAGNDGLTGGEGADQLSGGEGVDYCSTDILDTKSTSCFQDSSKPKIVALAYQKSKVNTDHEGVARLRATITDTGTGVMSVGADVSATQTQYTFSASGSETCAETGAEIGQACIVSGNRNRGVWELAFGVPKHTPAKKFSQLSFMIRDSASNQNYIEAVGDLAVSFSTIGTTPDAIAPVVEKVSASIPNIVNATTGSVYEITFETSDNLSGVKNINAYFKSGVCISVKQQQKKICQNAVGDNDMKQLEFTQLDSTTWVGFLNISPSMFNSKWRLYNINIQDAVGNSREIFGSEASVLAPISFTLINGTQAAISDSTPPLVSFIGISPKNVNAGSASAISYVTIKASDDKGVSYVWASVIGPNSFNSEPELNCELIIGTRKSGTWKCSVQIPIHGAKGRWHVVFLVRDGANNDAELTTEVEEINNGAGYFVNNN